MASAIKEFQPNRANIQAQVGGMSQRAVANAANVTVTRTRAAIKSQGRIDTGRMLRDTHTEFARDSTPLMPRAIVTLGHDQVGVFQELGTRAHGPRRAKRMVFQIRGRGPTIFAKWVRGVTPGLFLTNAYKALTAADFAGQR